MSRGASAADRREFAAAWSEANAKLNPSVAELEREMFSWAWGTFRALDANDFPTEKAQFCALQALRAGHLKRPMRTEESEMLRRASRAIWVGTHTAKEAGR